MGFDIAFHTTVLVLCSQSSHFLRDNLRINTKKTKESKRGKSSTQVNCSDVAQGPCFILCSSSTNKLTSVLFSLCTVMAPLAEASLPKGTVAVTANSANFLCLCQAPRSLLFTVADAELSSCLLNRMLLVPMRLILVEFQNFKRWYESHQNF